MYNSMSQKQCYLAIIVIQLIYVAMFLLSKVVFDQGMNTFIFVFYRQATATCFLIPLAIFFEWKNAPPISLVTAFKIFMLAFIGITLTLNIYGIGLVYTSASLAAALTNTLPVITFILAVLLRMETLKLKTAPGQAKVVGMVVCMGGVATLAFYKGLSLSNLHFFGLHPNSSSHQELIHTSPGPNWILGCFLLFLAAIFWALWLVLQGGIIKQYPSKLLFTTIQCFFSSIQSFCIAISMERDPDQWKLGWNVRLLAVVYCGIFVTSVTYYLQAWVIEKKGPVFLALWSPFGLVLTILCSSFFLGEIIRLGSVIGGILLVGGLYCVMWGKSKEEKTNNSENCLKISETEKECSHLKDTTSITIKIDPNIINSPRCCV